MSPRERPSPLPSAFDPPDDTPAPQRREPVTPQEAARNIDEYFDSLLYDGMSMFELGWVEQQREQAHAELASAAMSAALGVSNQHRKL